LLFLFAYLSSVDFFCAPRLILQEQTTFNDYNIRYVTRKKKEKEKKRTKKSVQESKKTMLIHETPIADRNLEV